MTDTDPLRPVAQAALAYSNEEHARYVVGLIDARPLDATKALTVIKNDLVRDASGCKPQLAAVCYVTLPTDPAASGYGPRTSARDLLVTDCDVRYVLSERPSALQVVVPIGTGAQAMLDHTSTWAIRLQNWLTFAHKDHTVSLKQKAMLHAALQGKK